MSKRIFSREVFSFFYVCVYLYFHGQQTSITSSLIHYLSQCVCVGGLVDFPTHNKQTREPSSSTQKVQGEGIFLYKHTERKVARSGMLLLAVIVVVQTSRRRDVVTVVLVVVDNSVCVCVCRFPRPETHRTHTRHIQNWRGDSDGRFLFFLFSSFYIFLSNKPYNQIFLPLRREKKREKKSLQLIMWYDY